MAQSVSGRTVTAEALVRSQTSPRGMWAVLGQVLPEQLPLVGIIPPVVNNSIYIIRHRCYVTLANDSVIKQNASSGNRNLFSESASVPTRYDTGANNMGVIFGYSAALQRDQIEISDGCSVLFCHLTSHLANSTAWLRPRTLSGGQPISRRARRQLQSRLKSRLLQMR